MSMMNLEILGNVSAMKDSLIVNWIKNQMISLKEIQEIEISKNLKALQILFKINPNALNY